MQPMTLQQAFDLAVARQRSGDLPEAESLLRQVLAVQPQNPAAQYALFTVLYQSGRLADALATLDQALALRPAEPTFNCMRGDVLGRLGRLDEALTAFDRALSSRPDFPDAHFRKGNALADRGRFHDAATAYRRAMELAPDSPDAVSNLCSMLTRVGDLDQAIDVCRAALARRPDFHVLYRNLAWACREAGMLDEAIDASRRSIAARPDHLVHGDLLFAAHFHPDYDRRRLFDEHRRWYEIHARPLAPTIRPHDNDPSPDRRLRVGYVAHRLSGEPLGRFLLALLSHHDAQQVETYGYCDLVADDDVGRRLVSHCAAWRTTAGTSDESLADAIRADRIDILVDLNLHTQGNRLLVFARKPAPVQVTYLAYASTTGLPAIDYRLTDPYLDPPGRDDSVYAERTFRLPNTFWCFPAPQEAPPVGPPPAHANGFITFGCLNDYAKVTPAVRALWANLLRAVPSAQLLLHTKHGSHRDHAAAQFAAEGIDPARLRFADRVPIAAYFALYNRIDVALDPFPWAGGTTTCDALWMGVPVVSLVGETPVSRGGLSILSNVNLPDLAAPDAAQYLQTARTLAADLPRLSGLRSTLRPRMLSSPLMDAPRFARDVESAYRHMWRTRVKLLR